MKIPGDLPGGGERGIGAAGGFCDAEVGVGFQCGWAVRVDGSGRWSGCMIRLKAMVKSAAEVDCSWSPQRQSSGASNICFRDGNGLFWGRVVLKLTDFIEQPPQARRLVVF